MVEGIIGFSDILSIAQTMMLTLILSKNTSSLSTAIFTKCYIAIDSVSIGLLFRKYNMIDIAWWERIPHNEPKLKITDECNHVKILQVFPQFLVFGFFHSFFSVIESSFRIYLRELAPTACNNGTADFKSKYDLN